MIHYIKGRVTEVFDDMIVIENNGIGYEMTVPSSSALYIASSDTVVTAYTAMVVREDDVSLYGFDDRESLRMFRMLQKVNGIGAKAAVAILSALTVTDIKKAIVFNDPDTIARAKGVGKKTAQKVVLELKDSIDADSLSGSPAGVAGVQSAASGRGDSGEITAISDAIDALVMLGYTKSDASEAIAASGLDHASAEDYIKAALKKLSRF
ncbi:MAG: Holliday junction branch migration protein RuvA [Firmicutes bacterium]|nr:Holliday junction branch migration protein RuvA [Bacillota bacterium]